MNELAINNAEVTLQPKEITLNQVQIAQTMGELAYKSGIFKAPKAEAAAMIMLKGYELGFPMTAAAEFIQVIEGTVGLTPRGALAIMQSRPDIIRSVSFVDLEKDGKYYGCSCTIVRRRNGKDETYQKTFTLDNARQADLIKPKSGWEKYPEQMCQWRALGFASDIACPDLLAGLTGLMKMPELTAEGAVEPVAITYTEQSPVLEVVETKAEKPQITLSELIDRYGVENILAVNSGAMPKNNEECAEIAEKLESMK